MWSAAYHEKLYLRRAMARDFLRYCAPAVVYKNTLDRRPLSFQMPLFYPASTLYNQPAMLYVDIVVVQPRLCEA